jgi:signal peptidase I
MKTKHILLIVTLLVLPFVLLVAARLLKVYVVYSINTTNMDPTYPAGMQVFGIGFTAFEKGDVVSYQPTPLPGEDTGGNEYLGRIVATEGDTLQMISSFMYLNGKLAEDTMKHSYLFTDKMEHLSGVLNAYQKEYKVLRSDDTLIFNGSYEELKQLGILKTAERVLDGQIETYPSTFGIVSDTTWTLENMGPVVIPKDHVFIMGDNRTYSLDSRIRGFVSKDKFVAKIITGD